MHRTLIDVKTFQTDIPAKHNFSDSARSTWIRSGGKECAAAAYAGFSVVVARTSGIAFAEGRGIESVHSQQFFRVQYEDDGVFTGVPSEMISTIGNWSVSISRPEENMLVQV